MPSYIYLYSIETNGYIMRSGDMDIPNRNMIALLGETGEDIITQQAIIYSEEDNGKLSFKTDKFDFYYRRVLAHGINYIRCEPEKNMREWFTVQNEPNDENYNLVSLQAENGQWVALSDTIELETQGHLWSDKTGYLYNYKFRNLTTTSNYNKRSKFIIKTVSW